MSIQSRLSALEARRDAVLKDMDNNTTLLGNHLRVKYAPANVLRRHIGPAMGIAAAMGTLVAGINSPKNRLMRFVLSRFINRNQAPAPSSGIPTATPMENGQHNHPATHDHQSPEHPVVDAAEPILRNLVVGVVEAIPWRNIMGRVLEKRSKHSNHSPRDQRP